MEDGAAPVSLFNTAFDDVTSLTGTKQGERGSTTFTRPAWEGCGVEVVSDCGVCPQPIMDAQNCYHPESLIQVDFAGGDALPKLAATDPENPTLLSMLNPYQQEVEFKTIQEEGCCSYFFYPLYQKVGLADTRNCDLGKGPIADRVANNLLAHGHRLAARRLELGGSGTPGLATVAQIVNPVDAGSVVKVSECVGLSSLIQNSIMPYQLVVPYWATPALISSGIIRWIPEQGFVTSQGIPVLTDNGLTGKYGPPATPILDSNGDTVGHGWDGATPLTEADYTEADPGCIWVYLTGGVRAEQSQIIVSGEPDNGDADNRSNRDHRIAEYQTISIFDPCHVYAALIDINKGIACG
jgi:hypothetical protein